MKGTISFIIFVSMGLTACVTTEFDENFDNVRASLTSYDARSDLDDLKKHKGRKAFAFGSDEYGESWGYSWGYKNTNKAVAAALKNCQKKAKALRIKSECKILIKH